MNRRAWVNHWWPRIAADTKGKNMAKNNTGPIEDDGTLSGWYEERQRRSRERNPTRSVGDDESKQNDTKPERR